MLEHLRAEERWGHGWTASDGGGAERLFTNGTEAAAGGACAAKVYPSDPTDRQWAVLAPLLPPPAPRGRRRSVDPRAILDGILYVLGTGGSWRSLPRDLPKWITVYASFRRWL